MILEENLKEVKERDFLKICNHYDDLVQIETKLIFGKHYDDKVFLTIILPVYDHPEEFIKRALDSALNQNCNYKYQIIVIDDYAIEEQTVTEKYVRKLNDSRVIYYKNMKNMGVFGNWNRAILLAKSEWICFLHSDDFLKDNYLQNMHDIVRSHPDIDQLACNYKKLDFLNGEVDVQSEIHGTSGKRKLRKVKYTEYLYEMKTSVKGSFYKRDKLIEIGGFRSQGDGIGLDDYPLMMKFAYYFNTYLLEEELYLNSWACNDSLNTKHWYPELVENYYMWLYFAKKEKNIKRFFYEKAAKYLLLERAKIYKSGKSWVGVPIKVDYGELKHDCELTNIDINRLLEAISFVMVYIFQKQKNRIEIEKLVSIEEMKTGDNE